VLITITGQRKKLMSREHKETGDGLLVNGDYDLCVDAKNQAHSR